MREQKIEVELLRTRRTHCLEKDAGHNTDGRGGKDAGEISATGRDFESESTTQEDRDVTPTLQLDESTRRRMFIYLKST